jgi:hypothetical protein
MSTRAELGLKDRRRRRPGRDAAERTVMALALARSRGRASVAPRASRTARDTPP